MREPIFVGFFVGLKSYTDISVSVIADEDDGGGIRNRRFSQYFAGLYLLSCALIAAAA
jgi:hypothetical protein